MRVLVTGATGFLGAALVPRLEAEGHEVRILTRSPRAGDPRTVGWDPAGGRIDAEVLAGLDAVVHLAGENIFGLRWTQAKRRRIRESRVLGTTLLAERLAARPDRPRVLLSISGVDYYGDGKGAILTEASPRGRGFLAEVCEAWEAAADPARAAGIRVVHPRLGVVLGEGALLLRVLAPAFRLGLGAYVGPGDQWLSWVAREDVVRALLYLLSADGLEGPVNVASPRPVTQRAFGDALARVLSRPRFLKAPRPLVRLGLGTMADELILSSKRVMPERLSASGFTFTLGDVEAALAAALGLDKGETP